MLLLSFARPLVSAECAVFSYAGGGEVAFALSVVDAGVNGHAVCTGTVMWCGVLCSCVQLV